MGYAINASPQRHVAAITSDSNILSKTGDGSDSLANYILACFFARIAEKCASHALNLPHAQSADIMRMPAPITPPITPPPPLLAAFCIKASAPGSLARSGCTLSAGPYPGEKLKDNADGLLRRRAVDPHAGDKPFDQFVHYPLASPALSAGSRHHVDSSAG
jgi:hypothetical protein